MDCSKHQVYYQAKVTQYKWKEAQFIVGWSTLMECIYKTKWNGNVGWRGSLIYGRVMQRSEGSRAMWQVILSMLAPWGKDALEACLSSNSRPSF